MSGSVRGSRWRLGLITPLAAFASCSSVAQVRPTTLSVSVGIVDNLKAGGRSGGVEIQLTNIGADPLGAGWRLYFGSMRRVVPGSVSSGFEIVHVNGDWHRLQPAADYRPIGPGERRTIAFDAQGTSVNRSLGPYGFYLVPLDGAGAELPEPTAPEVTWLPFDRPEQRSRGPGDLLPVSTSERRYAANEVLSRLDLDALPIVTPTPAHWTRGTGRWTPDASSVVAFGSGLEREAAYLSDALASRAGWRLPARPSRGDTDGAIRIRVGDVPLDARGSGETYHLEVSQKSGVEIIGTDAAGVFYGIQSLLALGGSSDGVPVSVVDDGPRFSYRGQHLDVARNFQSVDAVKKLVDLMATYKLNRLHLHLSDDEGWRLEIPELPELTDVGGHRGHTLDERRWLQPSLGSGPDPATEASAGNGFYTPDEFVDILRFATARHIEVIPEFDLPGHARAAIVAMRARAERLEAEERPVEADAALLTDPGDTSQYMSVQGWRDNVVDVCRESTYDFLSRVVDAVVRMYAAAEAPLRVFHVGGDEVPDGAWERSPACEGRRTAGASTDHASLTAYFARRAHDVLSARGLIMGGWEEITLGRSSDGGRSGLREEAKELQIYAWRSIFGSGNVGSGYILANAGVPVVMASASHLYFDLAYEKQPDEPGLNWAGYVDTRRAWSLAPFDLYRSSTVDPMGRQVAERGPALLDSATGNILGIQGQLWGETLTTAAALERAAFPKLLGLAERAWARRPAWSRATAAAERDRQFRADWNVFANVLGRRELPRLDGLFGGVAYRLPPPGARIDDGVLRANVAFPGLDIRYTIDGTDPTARSSLYTGPIEVDGTPVLRTFDKRGRGSGSVRPGERR